MKMKKGRKKQIKLNQIELELGTAGEWERLRGLGGKEKDGTEKKFADGRRTTGGHQR